MFCNIYFDMDGTLAEWRGSANFEELYEKNYFSSLKQNSSLVYAARILHEIKSLLPIKLYVLTSVLMDSPYAEQEKREWIEKYLPGVFSKEDIIIVPYGSSKLDCVKKQLSHNPNEKHILVDDYTKNLKQWMQGGEKYIPVKCYNDINNQTPGTYDGIHSIDLEEKPEEIAIKLIKACI